MNEENERKAHAGEKKEKYIVDNRALWQVKNMQMPSTRAMQSMECSMNSNNGALNPKTLKP
jgi:hypothetical protein